jgi:hypothetical protein
MHPAFANHHPQMSTRTRTHTYLSIYLSIYLVYALQLIGPELLGHTNIEDKS